MARWINLPKIPEPGFRGFFDYLSNWTKRHSVARAVDLDIGVLSGDPHVGLLNKVWDFDKALANKYNQSKTQLDPAKALMLDDGNYIVVHGDTTFSSMPTEYAPRIKDIGDGNIMAEHDNFILSTAGLDMQTGNNIGDNVDLGMFHGGRRLARAITNLSEGNVHYQDATALAKYLQTNLSYKPIPKIPHALALQGFTSMPPGASTEHVPKGTELSIPGEIRGGDLETAMSILPEGAGIIMQAGGDKVNAVLRGKQVVGREEDIIEAERTVAYRERTPEEWEGGLAFLKSPFVTEYGPNQVPFVMIPRDIKTWQSKFKVTPHSFGTIEEWYSPEKGQSMGELEVRLFEPGPPYLNMRAKSNLVDRMYNYGVGSRIRQPIEGDDRHYP